MTPWTSPIPLCIGTAIKNNFPKHLAPRPSIPHRFDLTSYSTFPSFHLSSFHLLLLLLPPKIPHLRLCAPVLNSSLLSFLSASPFFWGKGESLHRIIKIDSLFFLFFSRWKGGNAEGRLVLNFNSRSCSRESEWKIFLFFLIGYKRTKGDDVNRMFLIVAYRHERKHESSFLREIMIL